MPPRTLLLRRFFLCLAFPVSLLVPKTSGAMSFARMDPAQTGVVTENNYADPRMAGDRFTDYVYGPIGTGIAAADFDNDGKVDLFVASKTEPSRLFRNLGNWRFEDITAQAGLPTGKPSAWTQGVSAVDVNNDGWMDLYVCRFDAPNQLWMNQGNGRFVEEAAKRGLALKDASVVGAFCDYDRDGWLDVYVLTNVLTATGETEGQPDFLLRNRGDGTFEDVSAKAGISGTGFGHSATWWDYDEDGWPDMYVGNDFAGTDRLYRNLGDGRFENVLKDAVPYHPYSSMGADLGDADGDGHVDLIIAEMAARSLQKDQRAMAESRAQLNRAGPTGDNAAQVMRNALFLGTGGPRVREAAILAGLDATDWTWSVRWEDFDCDGRLDLHVTNGMVIELHNTDLHERVRAAERPEDRVRTIRTMAPLNERNLAFRNLGGLQFEDVSQRWSLDDEGVSFGVATADFDGDGDMDLAIAHHGRGVSLHRNEATEGKRLVVHLEGKESNRFGIGARATLETDKRKIVRTLTSTRGYLSTSEPVLHFATDAGETIQTLVIEWPSGIRQTIQREEWPLHLSVPEAGTKPDVSNKQLPLLATREMDSAWAAPVLAEEAEQPPLRPWKVDRRGPFLASGDLNGDGALDVVMSGSVATPPRVFLQQKDGSFNAAPLPGPDRKVNEGPVLIADVNEDGLPDIVFTRGGLAGTPGTPAYVPVVQLNTGNGTFKVDTETFASVRMPVGAAVRADFNGDGRADYYFAPRCLPRRYPNAANGVLLFREGDGFVPASKEIAGALLEPAIVNAATAADLNGDGRMDLVLACEWGGVRAILNEAKGWRDGSRELGFDTAGSGLWSALAAADLNGDGKLDFTVGNVGLNTPYRGTASAPDVLFSGSFKGPGTPPVLVEAITREGQLFPRRSRIELGSAIPDILKKFPKNDAFAQATLPEILGPERIGAAKRWELTETRSGLILSQSDGTYRFAALPDMAQLAPTNAILVADLTGDGLADLCIGQNTTNALPSLGPFNASLSLVLVGAGDGTFTALPPDESGLRLAGSVQAFVPVGANPARFLAAQNRGPCIEIELTRSEDGK